MTYSMDKRPHTLVEEPMLPKSSRKANAWLAPCLWTFGLAGLLMLSVATLIKIMGASPSITEHKPQSTWTDCGTTPSEARSRNCHFDLLSFAWQTPECYDAETTSTFLTHNPSINWTFYSDWAAQRPVPQAEAQLGERTLFVTNEYHFTHCTYMWRQLHRAYAERGYVDEHVDGWEHTLHCQKVLLGEMDMGEMGEVKTAGRVVYPKCRKI